MDREELFYGIVKLVEKYEAARKAEDLAYFKDELEKAKSELEPTAQALMELSLMTREWMKELVMLTYTCDPETLRGRIYAHVNNFSGFQKPITLRETEEEISNARSTTYWTKDTSTYGRSDLR